MYVATPFEDCPVCGERIECGEIDSRSEWCRCNYYCGICNETFTKLVTFKIQSDEVASEEWEDLPGEPHFERDQTVYFMWDGWEERGRVWKRHVRNGAFHYHIDCPSVVKLPPPDRELEFTKRELRASRRRPG